MPDVDDGPAENDQQHPQHNNPQQQLLDLPYRDYIVRIYFGYVINLDYILFSRITDHIISLVYCDLYCGVVGCSLAKAKKYQFNCMQTMFN